MLTKAIIEHMSEDDLRTKVLIPLFKEMKYRDVYHHHGSSGELGKDIVMWNLSDLGTRVNYAVVAKKGKVSGSVSGKGGVSEVCTQVQQCFGANYLDPVSSQEQTVDRCLVVASGTIPKEAIAAIKSTLKTSHFDRLVDFINGDNGMCQEV